MISEIYKFLLGIILGMLICYSFILRSKWWINFKTKYIKMEN